MESKEHRRKSKRYPVKWKAAVVFDKTTGKPVLHTQTQDLSAGGAAIHSTYEDLTGTVLTLLLAQPSKNPAEQPKMLKVRARVVSTMRPPARPDYRHGLSFVRSADDGLDQLEELLKTDAPSAPAAAAAAAPAAAAPAPAVDPGATTSRLATLRAMAQAKLTEVKGPDPKEAVELKLGEAMERAHKYLKELAEQLNVIKPSYKTYIIAGLPEFPPLAWESGYADIRTREVSKDKKIWEHVAFYYKLSGGKHLVVKREYPASERLARLLTDNKIEFKARDTKNERGSLAHTTFEFDCAVQAFFLLVPNYETGLFTLRMRNVERFGIAEHVVHPEAVTDPALEEFAGYILGESPRVGALLSKTA